MAGGFTEHEEGLCHGPSILEMLWDELESNYRELRKMNRPKSGKPLLRPEYQKKQGLCAGLARAIAIMTNPYAPDEEAVREQIVERTS